ncbi:hypothetical protein CANMA_001131 [Candida margitis]|uniref:uncharacterized protein n=1 Tax=Candida margitis TaxID=1775924 RepID=UPI0022261350|nr:uncharacterized protein CANMA_001131 [Candida margitis]KAI5969841.1 hypothetical protein CANMA_001131 [Candida margitis]
MHQPSPKMGSFPTFIRESEQSPRGIDSAFPPFNPVHKYRGVYERAGFDVNKKGYKQSQNDDRGSNRSISNSNHWGHKNHSNDSFGNRSNGSGSYKTATKESLPLVGQVPDSGVKSGESSSESSKSNSMQSYGRNNSSASTSNRTSPEHYQFHEQSQSNTSVSAAYPEQDQQYRRKDSYNSNDSRDSSGRTVTTARYNEEAEYNTNTNTNTINHTSPNKQHKNVKNLTLDLNNNTHEQEPAGAHSNNSQQFVSHHPSSSMHSLHSKHSKHSVASHHSDHSNVSHHSDHSVASQHSSNSHQSNRSNGYNGLSHQEVIEEVSESTDSNNENGPSPTATTNEDKYAQHGYQIPTPSSANGPVPPQMYHHQGPPQPFDPRKTRKRPPMMMNGPPSGPMNPSYPSQSNRNITPPSNQAVPYPMSPNFSPKLQQQPMNGMAPMPGAGKVTSPTQYHHHPHSGQPMYKANSPTAMYQPGMPRSMSGMPHPMAQPHIPNPSLPRSMTGIPPGPPSWQMNSQQHPQSPGYPPRSQRRPAPPPMVSPTQQQQPHFQPQLPIQPQQMVQQSPMNSHQTVPPNQRYQTGIPRQPTYSQIREDKLSPALDEFKQDLQTHQSSGPANPAQLQNMSPDVNSAKLENSLNVRLMADDEENDLHHQKAQSPEYQQFLSTEPVNKSQGDYNRGSMVSSILSKESISEEDKRIEQELETHLQNLKNGSENVDQLEEDPTYSSPQKSVSEQSTMSAPRPPIPQFSVQDVDEEKKTRDSSGSNNTKDSNCDDMSIASIESIQPLSVSHSHVSPTRRDMKQVEDNFSHPNGVPERKDSAEFTKIIAELDQFEEQMPNTTSHPDASHTKPKPAQYEPGMGPCRSCNQPIDPSARGSLKSIFSKTGELSGQWHRGCFKCSYQSCPTHFNKQVQCYVLDDEPYCFQHYHLLNSTTCKSCGVGIEGSCIENDLGQKWHMHCLKCSCCQGQIEQDYYVVNDSIMCEADAKQYLHRGGGSGDDKVEKRRTRMYYA